jgi:hypothetical protein
MKKYNDFVNFMDDLEKNSTQLVKKLADAEKQVNIFKMEMDSANAMADASDGKLASIAKKLEDNPLDIQTKEQHNIWLIHKSDFHARAESLAEALEVAQKEYAQLVKENSNLDPTSRAESAVIEMKGLIDKQYKDFCNAINDAVAARAVYLASISKVNQIKNAGRHLVEAGVKAQSYSKKEKLGHGVTFETSPKPFLVSEADISKA